MLKGSISMDIYVDYKLLSESLRIPYEPSLDDQYYEDDGLFDNYAPYGGGASGSKNGHYGCRHSQETKDLLRELRLGKTPPNKGVPNPEQSDRFKKNNPMFNPESREKMRQSKLGKVPHNKITTTVEYSCLHCGKKHTRLATKHSQKKFCDKSCAASYSNARRYISQPPAAEQASS
jgi:hypothetical protein